MALQPEPDQAIDRSTTTPFYLRVFCRENDFHKPADFTAVPTTEDLNDSCINLYTWADTTLSELTGQIANALPNSISARATNTHIGYRLIFPDTRSVTGPGSEDAEGRWLSKPLGSVVVSEDTEHNGDGVTTTNGSHTDSSSLTYTGDSKKTLADARFVIGDYVSCAIIAPLADGSVAPLPPAESASFTSNNRRRGGRGGGAGPAGRGDSFRGGRPGGRGGYSSQALSWGPPPARGGWDREDRQPEVRGGWGRGGRTPERYGDWPREDRLPDRRGYDDERYRGY